jgi:chromosome segregation ATPase
MSDLFRKLGLLVRSNLGQALPNRRSDDSERAVSVEQLRARTAELRESEKTMRVRLEALEREADRMSQAVLAGSPSDGQVQQWLRDKQRVDAQINQYDADLRLLLETRITLERQIAYLEHRAQEPAAAPTHSRTDKETTPLPAHGASTASTPAATSDDLEQRRQRLSRKP